MDTQSPSNAYEAVMETPKKNRPRGYDDVDNTNNTILLQNDTLLDQEHVEPDVKLLAIPFMAIVILSNGALIGFMAIFLSEVTMGSKISDPVGSSKNADKKVETYQLLNGYISAAAGELLNFAYFVFLAVMVTYFGNLPWHPGQNVRDGRGNVKKAVLWWFTPFMMYVVNVGITSMNIKHIIVGVEHIFVQDDLVTASTAPNSTTSGYDVQNTILRTAVLQNSDPFIIQSGSSCLLSDTSSVSEASLEISINESSSMPTVKGIDSTSVGFGFTINSWNYEALPYGLNATHSVNLTAGDLPTDAFSEFQATTGFDFLTGYEMFLQGKALFERSVSDANVSAEYPCSWVDGKYEDDNSDQDVFNTFDNTSEYANMRKCNGAVSSLQMLTNATDPSTHNLESFVNIVLDGMNTTLNQSTKLSLDETTFLFETYKISDQLNLTMMTLDIPLDLSVHFSLWAGTYISGDAFNEQDALPFMINPRRHLMFSFAKLDWQLEDVSKMFNAGCEVPGGCDGLVHKLQNGTSPSAKSVSVLVVGNSTIPSERMDARFINPVQLVTLNAQPLLYPKTKERHLWEYVQMDRFDEVTWADANLGELNCSVLVDSFITQVENNHYYLDDPRQVMYTSALYYLFQNAATKTVTLGDKPDGASSLYIGSTRLNGDTERKKIKYSIPLSSAIATFIGIAIVIGFSFIVVITPIDRVMTSRETNFAARYTDLLTKEDYPSEVHNCNLRVPGGELLPMEDCTVERITLHSLADESEKVFL
ncbi:Amino Acid-Polyamine-Organocation (APC) Family [Phytophthora nicotianae]|uniref:Amino Acid-Polyamine-Organocation (APC) Family n=1 Tax=Phytophthora nicotianae TaxID=4792 RepID=A0A0W8DRJ3_PHYNI|nr:Amino Acid-Polyamine-Organocation (APC) Family [Phytophthora nicotianae]